MKDDGLCLNLDPMGSDRSGITIHPRFQINTEGDKIEPGSHVNVIFRHKQETLSAAPFSAPPSRRGYISPAAVFGASQQEFTDSHRTDTSSIKIHLYARYDANASKYLTANDGWLLQWMGLECK